MSVVVFKYVDHREQWSLNANFHVIVPKINTLPQFSAGLGANWSFPPTSALFLVVDGTQNPEEDHIVTHTFIKISHSRSIQKQFVVIATSRSTWSSSIFEAVSNGTDPRSPFAAKTSSETVTFVFSSWVIALLQVYIAYVTPCGDLN